MFDGGVWDISKGDDQMAGAIKREPGESFASFSTRQRAAQDAERAARPLARKRRRSTYSAKQRASDRVDGYDRDDRGESFD